jgi:hypothetical protein
MTLTILPIFYTTLLPAMHGLDTILLPTLHCTSANVLAMSCKTDGILPIFITTLLPAQHGIDTNLLPYLLCTSANVLANSRLTAAHLPTFLTNLLRGFIALLSTRCQP